LITVRRRGWSRALSGHTVHTAQSKGWDTLNNGALLSAAEEAGFELLLTTDRRIRHQQHLRAWRVSLVVVTGSTTKWSLVRRHADRIAAAVASATLGSYVEIETPFEPK
jgi:DNA-binding PucR family transcriptional regulator